MIREFNGEFAWASNFWPARVIFEGDQYPTVEHAYQAAKTVNPEVRRMILTASTAGQAKRLGRAIQADEWAQPKWPTVKIEIMFGFLQQKFTDETLRRLLVATGDEPMQEGNTWGDEYWGVSFATGKGLNMLGILLMLVRSQIVRHEWFMEEAGAQIRR
jgi:ribA/ribD-fused uncharacterized protein